MDEKRVAALVAAARKAAADVPGVVVTGAGPRVSVQPSSISGRTGHVRRERGLAIRATGWSTGLHDVDLAFPVPDGEDVEAAAGWFAATQRRRALAGARAGSMMPFRWRDGRLDDIEIRHLSVSRSAVEAMLETAGGDRRDVAALLRRSVHDTLSGDRSFSARLWLSGRQLEPSYSFPGGSCVHRVVTIHRSLPETVVAAMTGRRMDQVAETGAAMGGRIVLAAATNDEGGLDLRLSNDHAPVGDMLGVR